MNTRPPSTRVARHLVIWMAVCVLLLKAAVPMLASASAQVQGKALIEVCTVYGVATMALNDGGGDGNSQPAPDHGTVHAGDHCALSALMALAAPAVHTAAPFHLAPRAAAMPPLRSRAQAPDASAIWVARLKHGPPPFA